MANEFNTSLLGSLTNVTAAPPTRVFKIMMVKKVYYFIIAITAFLGNLLVAAFFYQNRKTLLKKTYYVVLFALSITDILTSVFLIATPAFVFGNGIQEPTNRLALLVYCKLLWGRLLLLICAVASVYLILLLTVDRWIAVIKHTKYKTMMNRGRAIKGIALCYFIGVLFILPSTPSMNIYPNKPSGQRCSFANSPHLKVTVTVNFFGKAVFPFLAIAIMYAHIVYKMKKSSGMINQQQSTKEPRKRTTRIALIASFVILICWLPNQINMLLLYAHQKSSLQTTFHDFTVGLLFINSCINPFLYGFTSKKFRKGYVKTLQSLVCTRSTFLQVRPSSDAEIGEMNQRNQQCPPIKTLPIVPTSNDQIIAVEHVERKDVGGFDIA